MKFIFHIYLCIIFLFFYNKSIHKAEKIPNVPLHVSMTNQNLVFRIKCIEKII